MKNLITKLLIITFVLMTAVNLNAAFLKEVPQSLSQPDGSVLNCFASGDEFFNWLHDANGFTIIQNPVNGWFVYADMQNDEFIPTTLIPNKDNPAQNNLKPWLIYSEQKLRSFRNKFSIPAEYKIEGKKSEKLQAVRNRGPFNNLAIFIRFADETGFTQNSTYFDTPYNGKNGISVYDYFYEVSYNQIEIKTNFFPQPNGQIVMSYQDNYPRSYYKKYNATTAPDGYKNDSERTIREMQLLKKAVEAVAPNIPADLDLDSDDDGTVDNVAFIVTGGPEGWADLIWPHMWALYYYDVRINGMRVWNFNFLMANWFDSSVLCHEMFHTLGSPDLYRYYVGGNPVGQWDLMSNNTYPPQYTSMFMRWKYGNWVDDIPEVTKSGWYELNPSSMKNGSSIRVKSRYSQDEYFVLEYRKKEGRYDVAIPKSGLVVWRINSLYDGNAGGPPDGVYLYRKDGTSGNWGNIVEAPLAADYGRVKMNDYSTNPKPFLTSGGNGGLNISDVGYIGNTIKFRINFPPKTPYLVSPVNLEPAAAKKPVFLWDKAEDADYYLFELATDANFTNIIHSQNNIQDTKYELPFELDYLSSYYWRVKSYSNYEEESGYSAANMFTVTPERPRINNYTPSKIICENEDFSIYVSAEGSVMQFQWFKDGNPIAGANDPLLTRENAGFLQSAVYMCRVTNYPGKDSVYSEKIGIYVITNTDFTKQPQSQIASVGGSVNFTFRVHVNGKEDKYFTDIKWYKNDVVLTENQRITGTKSDILNITNLMESDFGAKYKVEVTGRCGTVLSSDDFTIEKLPNPTVKSYDTTLCVNNDYNLYAGMDTQLPDNVDYIMTKTGDIDFNVSKIDGKYYFVVNPKEFVKDKEYFIQADFKMLSNDYVFETYKYSIKLNIAPEITYNIPEQITLNEGDVFVMAPSLSEVPLKSEWYKDNVKQENLNDVKDYTTNYAPLSLAGEWKIKFYNDCGEVWTRTCKVTIIPKGDNPTDLSDENSGSNINLYPNPVNNLLNISLSGNDYQTIDIFDLLGNKILTQNISSDNKIISIDLTDLNITNGTYILVLKGNSNVKTLRFNLLK